MRRMINGLILCVAGMGAGFLPSAQAAEPSTEFSALSAEVQAVKAHQLAIQADLKAIRELLAGSRPTPAPAAAAAAAPAPAAAAAAVPPPAPEATAAPPAPAASTAPGDADMAALRKELEAMKAVVARYKERDEKARKARLPVRDVEFTLQVGDDPFKGSADAPVALVEFTDYQCPFCARHIKDTLPKLVEDYVESGKVRYVLRDYPLGIHKHAPKAHEAAHCAGEQGKYWEMHHELFANHRALMEDKLAGYAEAAGVADLAAFQSCLDSGKHAERGQLSLAEGAKAGVSGTPSFLLGVLEPDGSTVKATKFIRGAQAYSIFEDAIKGILPPAAQAEPSPGDSPAGEG